VVLVAPLQKVVVVVVVNHQTTEAGVETEVAEQGCFHREIPVVLHLVQVVD
jgi:hypothetical protein